MVDGNCFYIRIFYIFYQLCPLVWNIEIERGKENEKVGCKQAKLNESDSGREPEKGGKILLTSNGRGNREKRRNLTDEQRQREQERDRERRRNFTDEQREREQERNRERRQNFSAEQRGKEQERERERRQNFTEEQLENERERARENRRRISDERRRTEREAAKQKRRRLNEDEREGEGIKSGYLQI